MLHEGIIPRIQMTCYTKRCYTIERRHFLGRSDIAKHKGRMLFELIVHTVTQISYSSDCTRHYGIMVARFMKRLLENKSGILSEVMNNSIDMLYEPQFDVARWKFCRPPTRQVDLPGIPFSCRPGQRTDV